MIDLTTPIDVAIIGGGPAGLAAATALKQAGISRVLVLEREAQAGGIPRHCGHPPFGMREFKRILKGPVYAARLVQQALATGVEVHCHTTVVEARAGGQLLLATPEGLAEITPRRVIYATGVREAPRASRLISGARLQGILNTGALQSMVFLKQMRPFRRPVIIGTELVSFSAISTCRHLGIQPVAMIEAGSRTTARWPTGVYPRLMGVPLHLNTQLVAINGGTSVTGVTVRDANETRDIACDGVILSGQFTPESTLARMGHLDIDPATGGPVVDQFGRCTDPVYFATGNLLRPVETAGWSWNEGCQTGHRVAADLNGTLPADTDTVKITTADPLIKYIMPQRLLLGQPGGMSKIQLRVTGDAKGRIIAKSGDKTVGRWAINSRKERRILLPIRALDSLNINGDITLSFEP